MPEKIPTPQEQQKKSSEKQEKYRKLRGLERFQEKKNEVVNQLSDILEQATEVTDQEVSVTPEGDKKLQNQIESLQKDIGGEEAVEERKKEGFRRMYRYMKQRKALLEKKEKLEQLQREMLQRGNKNKSLKSSTDFWEITDQFQKTIESIRDQLEDIACQSPESFITDEILKLRTYKEQLEQSGIIETPYIDRKKTKIEETLLKNGTVALVGETGTGKTRIAEKISRTITGKSPEWVFGHGQMTKEDLLYHLGIKPEKQKAYEVPELLEQAKEEFAKRHPGMSGEEQKAAFDQIEKVVAGQAQEKTMSTEPVLGPVLNAAQEGKTVIVDEFNYIPPQLLAGLNALIEAKPGQTVEFMGQEVEVKEGFGIIFTGNISKTEYHRYRDREKLDPAFVNRLNSGLIEYNTPPQDINKNFAEIIPEEDQEAEETDKDLFLIALTHLVDEKGNLKAKENTLDEAWRLSRTFALMQKIYAGENIQEVMDAADISGTSFEMKKYHASLRTFGDILEDWKKDAFDADIDWYLYNNLLRPSYIVAPHETAQMFYILQSSYGNFFDDEVWDGVKVDTTSWTIQGLGQVGDKIDPEKDVPNEQEDRYYLPQELAEIMGGETVPEIREEAIEEKKEATTQQERAENVKEARKEIKTFEKKLQSCKETVKRFCKDEKKIKG